MGKATQPHITAHAIQRYQERVENIAPGAVITRLTSPIISKAISFGARTIRLGTGQRLIVADGAIITITPKEYKRGCLSPQRDILHRRRA